jgi:hypothetical protein
VRVGTYPTRNFAYSFLTPDVDNVGAEAFLTSLHVAMQMGPYLQLSRTVWRMASEDSAHAEQSFLLIVRTRRIVTARCSSAGFSGFPAYSQILLRQLLSYLRTVIVTAAVYRGFISELAPLHLTFRHRAGVSPYTSAYALAETCVFSKQSDGPFLCGPRQLTE